MPAGSSPPTIRYFLEEMSVDASKRITTYLMFTQYRQHSSAVIVVRHENKRSLEADDVAFVRAD